MPRKKKSESGVWLTQNEISYKPTHNPKPKVKKRKPKSSPPIPRPTPLRITPASGRLRLKLPDRSWLKGPYLTSSKDKD